MELMLDRLIAVVLALTSFQIKANPKADGADVLLAHAVTDAELVIAYDGKAILSDNYPTFLKAPDSPLLARSPRSQDILREAVALSEQLRALGMQSFGGEPIDYMGISAILFIGLSAAEGDGPTMMFATRPGKLSPDVLFAGLLNQGTATEINGRRAMLMPNGMLAGIARDGTMLVGSEAWVRPRLDDKWKAPPRPKGSALAAIATALDARPFLTVASLPSATSVARLRAEAGQGFASDLYAGHTFAVLSASSTGLAFTYQARDGAFAARVKLATEGAIEILRAFHLAPRSALQLAAAALPSYAGEHQVIDELLAARQPILDALTAISGDGGFAAKVTLSGTRVSAIARGKKISDVVPASALLAFGAVVYLFADDDEETAPLATPPPPPPKPRPGAGSQPVKRPR